MTAIGEFGLRENLVREVEMDEAGQVETKGDFSCVSAEPSVRRIGLR